MAGRLPSIAPDKKLHRSNEELRERNEETPIYQRQEFKMPKSLTAAEKKVWKFLVQVFRETVNCRVSDADVDMMVLYCRAKVATDEADPRSKKTPAPISCTRAARTRTAIPSTCSKQIRTSRSGTTTPRSASALPISSGSRRRRGRGQD